MSIKWINRVWEHSKARGSALVLMLALADMANDDGECYPGKTNLAKKARYSDKRNVGQTLKQLQAMGEILINPRYANGEQTSNLYRLVLGEEFGRGGGDRTITPPVITRSPPGDHTITPRGDHTITPPVITRSPDPSFKPSIEPVGDPDHPTPPRNLIVEELQRRKGGAQ